MVQPVEIERHGKWYRGCYTTTEGMITVNYNEASKTTQLGGSAHDPTVLAQIMLAELVSENPG
jgi:hypothetical protein